LTERAVVVIDALLRGISETSANTRVRIHANYFRLVEALLVGDVSKALTTGFAW
jgi:hypothetical protein